MGKLIKNTNVKVDGQAGPLGKGVPLAKAAGPGGMLDIAKGSTMPQSPQVPGFKGMIHRGLASGRMNQPGQGFGKAQDVWKQKMAEKMAKRGKLGGFWGRTFKKLQQKQSQINPQGAGGMFGRLFQQVNQKREQLKPQGPGPQALPPGPSPQPAGQSTLPKPPKAF